MSDTVLVILTDDEAELAVKVGDALVFDPTGRDLGGEHLVVGVVVSVDEDEDEPAPLVVVNVMKPRQTMLVRRVKAVLS